MQNPGTKAVFFLLTPLILSACVTPPTYSIDTATSTRGTLPNTTVVVDKRPADDRESSFGSFLITSDRYGIHTLGDERFVPPPVSAFSQRLQRAAASWSPRPQSITLTIYRFKTENNMQATMRHGAMTSSGLTDLGMALGEAILGKMREQNIDMRKPFILNIIEANAEIRWLDGRSESRKINVVKAQNYDETISQEQQGKVISATVSSALDATIVALVK